MSSMHTYHLWIGDRQMKVGDLIKTASGDILTLDSWHESKVWCLELGDETINPDAFGGRIVRVEI